MRVLAGAMALVSRITPTFVAFLIGASVQASAMILAPELLYYRFDEGGGTTTANIAVPGAGSNPATVTAHTLDATGVFGSTALNGAGTGHVDTGWATSLTGSWTIAFWLGPVSPAGTFGYVFGDNSAFNFRAFTGGSAGATGIRLRSDFASGDILVTGLSTTAPTHIAFVYESAISQISGYVNGALDATGAAAGLGSLSGSNFIVGNRDPANPSGFVSGRWLDEFQVYSRALDVTDLPDAMNANFIGAPPPVPEPSTLVLFGLGAALVGLTAHRRRT